MAILERVMQMKQQGITEPEIIGSLRQEGVSPREIDEALSQAKIKSELDSNPESQTQMGGNPMEQSMMQTQQDSDYGYGPGYPQGFGQSSEYAQQYAPESQEAPQNNEGAQDYQDYSPDYQAEQGYPEYQPRPAIDIETINEICEQTIEEKTEKLKKEISSFSKFKEEMEFDVQKINERLTKIENNFNELQMAILKRIGNYGEDIKNIAREMHSTQESFSKMLDPLTDNMRELQRLSGEGSGNEEPKETDQRKVLKKPKTDFESYLR